MYVIQLLSSTKGESCEFDIQLFWVLLRHVAMNEIGERLLETLKSMSAQYKSQPHLYPKKTI